MQLFYIHNQQGTTDKPKAYAGPYFAITPVGNHRSITSTGSGWMYMNNNWDHSWYIKPSPYDQTLPGDISRCLGEYSATVILE